MTVSDSLPRREPHRQALRRAVAAVLAVFPSGSATTEAGSHPEHPYMWHLEITPAAPGAAAAYVAYGGGDEVTLGFGETHVYLWDADPDQLADDVRTILEAVFAGRFVEAGRVGDAFAKVSTRHGDRVLGAAHLPVPWRLRRTRTYAPYSS